MAGISWILYGGCPESGEQGMMVELEPEYFCDNMCDSLTNINVNQCLNKCNNHFALMKAKAEAALFWESSSSSSSDDSNDSSSDSSDN